MTFPRGAAAITGVYTTVQGKKLGRTEESLKLEAIKGALADSGLSFADIDGIVPMESSMHGPGLGAILGHSTLPAGISRIMFTCPKEATSSPLSVSMSPRP